MKLLLIILSCSSLLLAGACRAQTAKEKMTDQTKTNPLNCDPQTGACELPAATTTTQAGPVKKSRKPVKVIYFTDPICSSCWGIEPQLRKLKLEYGNTIEIEYHMGGLLPSWEVYNSGGISKPSDVAHHWEEASAYYDMPIDGDVWLTDPLNSSYPPSIAFKAAQMQSEEKAIVFLRRIREMVFMEKKNITQWGHLQQAAAEAGLDTALLHKDAEGKAVQLFRDDLQLAANMGVRGFPTLFLTNGDGQTLTLYGFKPYAEFAKAVQQVYAAAQPENATLSPAQLFAHYPTLTLTEFATLSNLDKTKAQVVLQDLQQAGVIRTQPSKNGALWIHQQP